MNIPKPETNVGALLGTYSPFELEENFLNNLSSVELFNLIIAELESIAKQPPAGRAVGLESLWASPQWKKMGQSKGWAQKILRTLIQKASEKAREAAAVAARQNGTLTQSDKLWRDKATEVQYALPDGVLVEEKSRGMWFRDVSGEPIGPAIYPLEELENGTIRFAGSDRWGRPIRDLVLGFAELESPKKCQTKLAAIGARMDDVEAWCALVQEILSVNDLRVPDPEPRESANEELERIREAVRASSHWLSDNVEWCPVKEFEKEFGPVTLSVRRRWAEMGWLLRDAATGRFTYVKSHGGVSASRHYGFRFPAEDAKPVQPAPDAGLKQLEATAAAEAAASSRH